MEQRDSVVVDNFMLYLYGVKQHLLELDQFNLSDSLQGVYNKFSDTYSIGIGMVKSQSNGYVSLTKYRSVKPAHPPARWDAYVEYKGEPAHCDTLPIPDWAMRYNAFYGGFGIEGPGNPTVKTVYCRAPVADTAKRQTRKVQVSYVEGQGFLLDPPEPQIGTLTIFYWW